MQLKYPGDKTAEFDPKTGSGTVGRVVGAKGQFFLITEASYDEEQGVTFVTAEPLRDPNVMLAQMAAEQ